MLPRAYHTDITACFKMARGAFSGIRFVNHHQDVIKAVGPNTIPSESEHLACLKPKTRAAERDKRALALSSAHVNTKATRHDQEIELLRCNATSELHLTCFTATGSVASATATQTPTPPHKEAVGTFD